MGHIERMTLQLVDSQLLSTREFWRKKFFDASDEEAADPRPFSEILANRQPAPSGGENG